VTVDAPRDNLVISNAPEIGAAPAGDGVRHRFAATAPLPTYLLQVAVGPFASGTSTAAPTAWRKHPLPVRVFATRDKADQLDFALANIGPIERLVEDYVGQPYPFAKLDAVATPQWHESALEDAGAILFADDVLIGRGEADPRFVSGFATDVPHEISHQWFGDLVTPTWWDDLWLNESFAEWLGAKIARQWRPGVDLGSHDNSQAFVAMNMDALAAVDALRAPVPTTADQHFTPITYGKGAQVVRMVAGYLGDDRFRSGVRGYLAAHRYGSATSDDFFAALGKASGDPAVAQAMRDFVNQPGVPLVTLERQGGKLVARQQRYRMLGSQLPQAHWKIPFCYQTGDTRHCAMLGERTMLAAGSGVLVPNVGGTGYYRFALAPADWHALLAESAALPADEALAVADSLWAQYRGGTLDSGLLLEGVRALAAHPAPTVALFGARATWRSCKAPASCRPARWPTMAASSAACTCRPWKRRGSIPHGRHPAAHPPSAARSKRTWSRSWWTPGRARRFKLASSMPSMPGSRATPPPSIRPSARRP
jgi:aminopeptidase N